MLTYLLLMVSSLVVGISRLLNGLFTFSDRTAKNLSWNNTLKNTGSSITKNEILSHWEGIHDTWNTSGQKAQGDIAGMVSLRTSSILPSCQRKQWMKERLDVKMAQALCEGKLIRNSVEVRKDSASRKCNVPFRDPHGTSIIVWRHGFYIFYLYAWSLFLFFSSRHWPYFWSLSPSIFQNPPRRVAIESSTTHKSFCPSALHISPPCKSKSLVLRAFQGSNWNSSMCLARAHFALLAMMMQRHWYSACGSADLFPSSHHPTSYRPLP